jgi:hypothetical protein
MGGSCSNEFVSLVRSKSHQRIVSTKEKVWEISRDRLVALLRQCKISKKARDKPPLLCNYMILTINNNIVTCIEMTTNDGHYKKYTTDMSLETHLRLQNIPATATITLSDSHYKQLL